MCPAVIRLARREEKRGRIMARVIGRSWTREEQHGEIKRTAKRMTTWRQR